MPGTVLVFGGGDPLPESIALPPADLVVAADSGIDRAHAAGHTVDIAVGDFDSVSAAGLATAEQAGTRLIRHPHDKAETDLELAMLEAMRCEPDRIVAVAIDGGRLDHFMANIALLCDPRFARAEVDAHGAHGTLSVIRDRRSFAGQVGELVTLLPMGGPAHGVRTTGLRYPLKAETLRAGSPRGVSNLFEEPTAAVSVALGTLLMIRPEAFL